MIISTLPNFLRLVKALSSLSLDPELFVVTGGGSLAAHGIRDCVDLDCVVDLDLAKKLDVDQRFKRLETEDMFKYSYEDIDFFLFKKLGIYSAKEQITTADIINGIRFVNLTILKSFKQQGGRDKDLLDVKLIDKHIESSS